MIKKLWHKMVNSAMHELRKQNEELKSQIHKNDVLAGKMQATRRAYC